MEGILNLLFCIVIKRYYEILVVVVRIYGGLENNLIFVLDGMFNISVVN